MGECFSSMCGNPEENVNPDISRNPPTREKPSVVIKQGTSFDEGVVRTIAKDKYEKVLRKAKEESKITPDNAFIFKDTVLNVARGEQTSGRVKNV